ncbi:hypothetical protein GCM10020295_64140 [Streptomyces cinereospinus]
MLAAGRAGGVARVEGVEHGTDVTGEHVRHRADTARRAHRVQGEVVLVAARVVRQVRAGQHLLGGEEVVGAVLDGHDAGMAGEPEQGLRFDAGAGAGRDVVQHERQAGGVGHLSEVRFHGVLRGGRL